MTRNSSKNNSSGGFGPSANTRSKVSIKEIDYNALDKIVSVDKVSGKRTLDDKVSGDKVSGDKVSGDKVSDIQPPPTKKARKEPPGQKTQAIIMSYTIDEFLSKITGVDKTTDDMPNDDNNNEETSSDDSWMDEYNEDEVEYLKKLEENDRLYLISYENELREAKKPSLPLRFKILRSDMSDGAKYLILNKLDEIGHSNDHKINQWVDGLAMVPFGRYAEPTVSIVDGKQAVFQFLKNANECLNESIFGHDEAKAQILEYIAQYITNPKSNGKCLALQGPPGNGKTTLVRNGIAKAIGRPFAQISLGGANDVSVLSGHDFTYEGSQCGRIVSILRETGIMNPVFYFDELDKVSTTHKGEDIYNFLCHLTDFSQNCAYHDKYYEGIDMDLSKAIFIFSFNDISRINPILLDRLHVIHTKGFSVDDKVEIAKNFIIPNQMTEIGLSQDDVKITDEALRDIIVSHCKDEQGVRKMKRILEGVLTKLNILQFTKFENGIKLPYDIPDLSFPVTVDHRILSKLIKDDITDRPQLQMYI